MQPFLHRPALNLATMPGRSLPTSDIMNQFCTVALLSPGKPMIDGKVNPFMGDPSVPHPGDVPNPPFIENHREIQKVRNRSRPTRLRRENRNPAANRFLKLIPRRLINTLFGEWWNPKIFTRMNLVPGKFILFIRFPASTFRGNRFLIQRVIKHEFQGRQTQLQWNH